MDEWVESCDHAERWLAAEGATWSVSEGALHLTDHPIAGPAGDGKAQVSLTLPSWVAGFVWVEIRYRATVSGTLSLQTGDEYQSCVVPPAADWSDHRCPLLHLLALREEARLTVAVADGTFEVDEIRIVPLAVQPSVSLPATDPLPSALDTLAPRSGGAIDGNGFNTREGPTALVRSKLFARPHVGFAVADGVALRLGGSVGHRWWTAPVLPVKGSGETALRISAPIGAARGYRIDLWSSHGPWLGPVGVRIGPALRYDREEWDEVLPAALAFGGTADLSLDAGPLALTAGVLPLWPVMGPRTALDLTVRGGLRVAFEDLDLGVEVAHRSTEIGPIVDGTVSLGVRLP